MTSLASIYFYYCKSTVERHSIWVTKIYSSKVNFGSHFLSPVSTRQQFSNALISPLNSQYFPHGGNFPPVKNPCSRCCSILLLKTGPSTWLGHDSGAMHLENCCRRCWLRGHDSRELLYGVLSGELLYDVLAQRPCFWRAHVWGHVSGELMNEVLV